MASGQAHLIAGITVSGLGATALISTGFCTPIVGAALWGVGSVAAMLPDVDSDHSSALELSFSLSTLLLMLILSTRYGPLLTLWKLWLLLAGVFLLLRFALLPLVRRYTRHRGNSHSLLSALCATLATAVISYQALGLHPSLAWICAAFVAFGYLSHLLLDEIVAVDFAGAGIKRSLGTALKPLASDSPLTTGLLLISCALLAWFTPPWSTLTKLLSQLLGQ